MARRPSRPRTPRRPLTPVRPVFLGPITLLAASGLLLAPGCSASRQAAGSETTGPVADAGFRLDLVIYAQPGNQPGNQPGTDRGDPLLEPTRLILEPGGVLRAAYGSGVDAQLHPPLARTLTRSEMAEIERLATDLLAPMPAGVPETDAGAEGSGQLTVQDGAALMTSDDLIPAAAVSGSPNLHPVVVVSATIDGLPRYGVYEEATVEDARPLLGRLAELTWRPG